MVLNANVLGVPVFTLAKEHWYPDREYFSRSICARYRPILHSLRRSRARYCTASESENCNHFAYPDRETT